MPDVIHADFGSGERREQARFKALVDRSPQVGSPELGTVEEWGMSANAFLKVHFLDPADTTMMFVPKAAFHCMGACFEDMARQLGILGVGPKLA